MEIEQEKKSSSSDCCCSVATATAAKTKMGEKKSGTPMANGYFSAHMLVQSTIKNGYDERVKVEITNEIGMGERATEQNKE